MGYYWMEEHGLIKHPAVEGTNTADEAVDFAGWVRHGLLTASGKTDLEESCTGATKENGR